MARRSNRKPPTEAERDARRKADRERIEQAARELLTTEGWQRWIKVRASNGLSRYSVSNQMLIALDCWSRGITPTYVAGFRAFLALNRCVRKGEKAIRILAPVPVKQRDDNGEETGEKKVFFRTVPVFDVLSRDSTERIRTVGGPAIGKGVQQRGGTLRGAPRRPGPFGVRGRGPGRGGDRCDELSGVAVVARARLVHRAQLRAGTGALPQLA